MFPGTFDFQLRAASDKPRALAGNYARWWSDNAAKEHQRKAKPDTLGFRRNLDDLTFHIHPGMPPVTIVLERCVTITGRVLDPDGKPVAAATVAPALTGSGNSLTGDTRYSVRTADDGTFEMKLPASGAAKYNLVAHDGNFRQWRTWANGVGEPIRTKPGEEIRDVELRLTRPGVVRGVVLDTAGKPAINREVQAQPVDKLENRYYVPTTRTDKEGRFELRFVRPGEQYIQAEPFWLVAEEAPAETSKRVVVTEGQTSEGVELRAEPAGTPAS
jgi:hypothetical protein